MSAYNSVVDTALRAMAPDLGAKGATRRVQQQQENAIKIPYILPVGFSDILFRRYGFDVVSTDSKPLTTDHPFMAIDRAVIREMFDRETKPTTSRLPTLCLGVSSYEVTAYYKNPAMEFYAHMSEGKDAVRMALPLLEDFLERFHNLLTTNTDVEVAGVRAKKVQVDIRKMEDLVYSYERARVEDFSVTRVHLAPPSKRYSRLFCIDAGYERTEAEWFEDFERYENVVAYVTGFYPDELVFPHMASSTSYIYKRSHRNVLGDDPVAKKQLVLELAKAALRMKFGPVVSVLALIYKVYQAYEGGVAVGDLYDVALGLVVSLAADGMQFFLSASRIAFLVASTFAATLSDRASVTYRHGYSNGYEHSHETWSLLMRKPVLTSPTHDFVIEVEIFQTAGSHRMFKLVRSNSVRPVVRTLSPPKGLRSVRILDMEATFSSTPVVPVYFSVLEYEYHQTINFLSGQMDATLTFEGVQTLVNRSAGGVKIATTEVMPPWTMEESLRWKFAVTSALEAQRRHGRVHDLAKTHAKQLLGFDRTQLRTLLRNFAIGASVVATVGLAIPIFVAYHWLVTTHSSLELVIYPEMEKEQRWVPTQDLALRLKESTSPDIFSTSAEFSVNEASASCACPTLALMQPFGKQKPKCLHKPGEHKKLVTVEVTTHELDELRAKVFTQRETAAPELQKVLDKFKDAIPIVGFSMELECDLVIGGPGVGKSQTSRTILTNLERKTGVKTFVYAPFNKLAADYPKEARGDNVGFNFRTTHRLIHERGVHTVLGDEFTCLEEMACIVSLYNCNASRFIATGDNKQTGVLPHEGQRFFSEGSKFRLSDFTKHLLPVQFRSDAYAVALANEEFGCGIYAHHDNINIPRVLPIDAIPANPNGSTMMTFTALTAQAHGQSLGEENTVRSNQGGTMKHVMVPVHTRDLPLIREDPLFLVAVTRHVFDGSLTFYAEPGECTTTVRGRLRLDDPEFMGSILQKARPDIDALYGIPALADTRAELNGLVNSLFKEGVVSVDEVRQVDDYKTAAKATLEEVVQKLEYTHVAPHCQECGELTGGSDEMCVCGIEVWKQSLDIAAESLREAVDFSEEGWCLPRAAIVPVLESVANFEKRRALLPKASRPAAKRFESTPLAGKLFLDYKEYAKQNGQREGHGISTDAFVSYLKMQGVNFIVENLHDNDFSVSEFFVSMPAIYEASDPVAAITITGLHASTMSYDRFSMYTSMQKVEFKMPHEVAEPAELTLIGYTTFSQLQQYYPRFKLERRGHLDLSLPVTSNSRHNPVGFVLKRLIGRKPVWAESFVVPRYSEVCHEPVGPRTFSLDAERQPLNFFQTVETEDQGYDRMLPNERLHGTDYYAIAGLLDTTLYANERCNHDIVDLSITENLQAKILTTQLLNPTNKRGNFELGLEPPTDFAIAAGYGLIQNKNAVETLACSQRYIKQRPVTRYSPEGAAIARKMAQKNLWENYDPLRVVYDEALELAIEQGWVEDSLQRGYGIRLENDFASGNPEAAVTFSLKQQEKISKKPTVDPTKIGQGISAVSATTNYDYGPLWRIANYRMSRFAKSNVIYDCGMSPRALKTEVTDQLATNVFDTCVTVDVVECDSRQNWFTAVAELEFWSNIMSKKDLVRVEKYFRDVRGIYKIKTFGLFSAKVEGPKPSGAGDTLPGNTLCVENHSTSALIVRGPSLKVKKGDDLVTWATQILMNTSWQKEVAFFTDFTTTVEYGSAQFTGKVVVPGGMYDDVIKKARKAVAHRVRTYKQWCEYQQSLRDCVEDIVREGIVPTVAACAVAYGISYFEAEGYYNLLYSLSHMGFDAWVTMTKHRPITIPNPPSVVKMPFSYSRLVTRHASYVDYVKGIPVKKGKTFTRKEQRLRQKRRL